jgi:hypothetical protein
MLGRSVGAGINPIAGKTEQPIGAIDLLESLVVFEGDLRRQPAQPVFRIGAVAQTSPIDRRTKHRHVRIVRTFPFRRTSRSS